MFSGTYSVLACLPVANWTSVENANMSQVYHSPFYVILHITHISHIALYVHLGVPVDLRGAAGMHVMGHNAHIQI